MSKNKNLRIKRRKPDRRKNRGSEVKVLHELYFNTRREKVKEKEDMEEETNSSN